MSSAFQKVEFSIPLEDSEAQMLAIKYIVKTAKPAWLSCAKLEISRLLGAKLNLLFSVRNPEANETVLVKVYGEKGRKYFDRRQEKYFMQVLHEHGLAPQLYVVFSNGMCYDFIKGQVLTLQLIQTREVTKLISKKLARFHTIPCGVEIVRRETVLQAFNFVMENSERYSRALSVTCGSKEALAKEFDIVMNLYAPLRGELVLGHGDLQAQNILFDPTINDVFFIDMDFVEPTFKAHDVGIFFNHCVDPNSRDPMVFPSREYQVYFSTEYLTEYKKLKGLHPPTFEEIESLVELSQTGALVNNLTLLTFAFADDATIDFNDEELLKYYWRRYLYILKRVKRVQLEIESIDFV